MEFKDLFTLLEKNKFYIFSLEDLMRLYPGQHKDSLKQLLFRWNRKGYVLRLKKGLYELVYPRSFNIPDLLIANRLYEPSYVSLETALSHYSIIPEVAMAVTSVTTKPTRKIETKRGLFYYRTVRSKCFCGYYVEKSAGFSVLVAEPEKALADYVYFKTFRNKILDVKEERLDMQGIAKLDRRKIEKYLLLYGLKMKEVFDAYI